MRHAQAPRPHAGEMYMSIIKSRVEFWQVLFLGHYFKLLRTLAVGEGVFKAGPWARVRGMGPVCTCMIIWKGLC